MNEALPAVDQDRPARWHRPRARPVLRAVALTLLLSLAWLLPAARFFDEPAHYLPLHTGLEFLSLVVGAMIVSLAWNLREDRHNSHVVLLGAAFLFVGLVDFAHVLSYKGMPVFVTPSDPEKAINFWLMARLGGALGLLAVALRPVRDWGTTRVAAGFFLALAAAALAWWLGLFHAAWLPRTFIPGSGLTAFKAGAEYLLAMMYAVAALALYRRAGRQGSTTDLWLAAAAWTLGLTELLFTIYADVTDLFNLMGHLYKVVADWMIYRALYAARVQEPFHALRAQEARLEQLVAIRTEEVQVTLAQYRIMVENAPVAMAMLDRALDYLAVSRQWAEMNGHAKDELIGRNHYEIYPECPAFWRAAYREALTGKTKRCEEDRVALSGGACRWWRWATYPWRNEKGEIGGIILFAEDITARKLAEEELKAAKLEAERANEAKSRFLAAASHDLRQPLSALSLYAKVLEGHLAPSGVPLLANLNACVGSLSALLTDLLDLSKLQAGVVRPNVTGFPVSDLLANVVSVHEPKARLKGLQLRARPSALNVHTDPVLLERIVGNLLDNAIRYTGRGGVLIGCRRRQGKAWVEVWDTGIGIPPDKRSEIFEEFRQLGDEARTRGSGLGLAIVARTAALLGLEVSVRSRPGRGSVFAIELPLGEAPPVVLPDPGLLSCRPLRIALAEDNAMVREALAAALHSIGHQVVAAGTGAALCAALRGQSPDVVVSDYRLEQGETGFDVINAVRAAAGQELPAIVITGDTDPKLVRSLAERGIVVLHKPVDIETLQAYIEDLSYEGEALAQ